MTRIAEDGTPNLGAVRVWLWSVAALVFLMVCVGGATRLTESGLSITQWKPVTGVLPPLNPADWQAEFDRYKAIPQYAKLNSDMILDGFKIIFAWEWAHRLLARIVGAAFVLPALRFWWTGRLRGAVGRWVVAATAFLALEPVVGWWMVSSGLSVRIEVSQERLALHLLIAAATFSALIAAAVATRPSAGGYPLKKLTWGAWLVATLLFAQLGLGALVAGLRGGLLFNSWPTMNGQWIPDSIFKLDPGWRSAFGDAGTAQFDHRVLAYILVAAAIATALMARGKASGTALARRSGLVAALVVAQAALGVATVLLAAPLAAALPHQAFAMIVFGVAMLHWRLVARDGVV